VGKEAREEKGERESERERESMRERGHDVKRKGERRGESPRYPVSLFSRRGELNLPMEQGLPSRGEERTHDHCQEEPSDNFTEKEKRSEGDGIGWIGWDRVGCKSVDWS
jgi:hypothetical protein